MQEVIEKIDLPLDNLKDQKILKSSAHFIKLYPDYFSYKCDFDSEEVDYAQAGIIFGDEDIEEKSLEDLPSQVIRRQALTYIDRQSVVGICIVRITKLGGHEIEKVTRIVISSKDADDIEIIFLNIKQAQEIQQKLVAWRWP